MKDKKLVIQINKPAADVLHLQLILQIRHFG